MEKPRIKLNAEKNIQKQLLLNESVYQRNRWIIFVQRKENGVEIIYPVKIVDFKFSVNMSFNFGTTDRFDAMMLSQQKFYYTINAPKKIRSNSNYTLNLTIHDTEESITEPIVVRVSIEDEDKDDGVKIQQDVTMKPNATEVASIPVGDLPIDCNYKLVVQGISGVVLKNEADLDLQIQTHTILIQTDKAIYKPNDCIKYRVLVLDSELKAAPIDQNELSISVAVS